MFIPLLFIQFGRLDQSFFPVEWQAWDSPHRAFQSVLQIHTRSTNPLAFVFAENLYLAAGATRATGDNGGGERKEAARRARTRWHLAKTLIRNPSLVGQRGAVQSRSNAVAAPPPQIAARIVPNRAYVSLDQAESSLA
jgi:hypothetical protein